MDVKLIHIHPEPDLDNPRAPYSVAITLVIDGNQESHTLVHKPAAIPVMGAGLIVPSPELEGRFRLEQYALHRICKLAGRHIRGGGVRLPQQIAA